MVYRRAEIKARIDKQRVINRHSVAIWLGMAKSSAKAASW